jgi:ankyrin repeat protein
MLPDGSQDSIPTPLIAACSAGDLPTLTSLLRSFNNSHPRSDQDATIFLLLAEATKLRHRTLVEYLLEQTENTDYSEDLIWSALAVGSDIYKLYLAKNPDILKFEWQGIGNVVCSALRRNDVALLTYLLETVGADAGRFLESTRMGYIYLPLEWVAYSSTESNARLLLKYGAIVKGTCALQLAATGGRRGGLRGGRLGMVRLLVEAGADVNGMLDSNDFYYGRHGDPQGTALHYAAESGAKEVVEFLMVNGADTTKLDGFGHTAIERAESKGRSEIASLIRSYEMRASSALSHQDMK